MLPFLLSVSTKCRLQTGYKMQTRYKMQTADCIHTFLLVVSIGKFIWNMFLCHLGSIVEG